METKKAVASMTIGKAKKKQHPLRRGKNSSVKAGTYELMESYRSIAMETELYVQQKLERHPDWYLCI